MICKHRVITLTQDAQFAFTAFCHECHSYIHYNASFTEEGDTLFEFPREAQAGWVIPISLSVRFTAGHA